MNSNPTVSDYLAVGCLAAGVLAFEILLLRIFSFSQWHHFASLAVSLALLGFGAGATLLVLLGERARRWGDALFLAGGLLGGVGMVVVFALNQMVVVRPLFIVWDLGELARILFLDFAAFVPFFGIGVSLGQVFVRWPEFSRKLYAANLLGSGAGSVAATVLLAVVRLEIAWLLVAAGALALCVVYGANRLDVRRAGRAVPLLTVLSAAGLLTLILWAGLRGAPSLPVSDFKRLAYLLDLPDAVILDREYTTRGMATEIRSDSIRVAPGLSLRWTKPIPAQDALVLDADRVIPLPRTIPDPGDPRDFRPATLGAIPYRLRPEATILVLGTSERLEAFLAPAEAGGWVDWVESDPRIVNAVCRRIIYEGLIPEDPRRHLATTDRQYDIIVVDAAAAQGDSLTEDPLLTVEGFAAALARLRPAGLLVVPLQISNPPRHFPKCLAMVRDALVARGVENPAASVAVLRSLREGLILASPAGLTLHDRAAIRSFSMEWQFDLVWLGDIDAGEVNRFHQFSEPLYYESARSILTGGGPMPRAATMYTIRPPTDRSPYFWHTMRWSRLPEAWRVLGREGLMLFDWGMLVMTAALVVAALLGGALILLPLRALHIGGMARVSAAGQGISEKTPRLRTFFYFAALGLAYLTLEMAALQRCVLLLGNPVVAAALVFGVFLVGSGLGSLSAPEEGGKKSWNRIFGVLIVGMGIAAGGLWAGGDALIRAPYFVRLCAIAGILAPVCFAMGRPLPWGLRRLDNAPALVPWAWGINGFASVVAAPLATLLSVQVSQPATWIWAVAAYGVAAVVARGWAR